MDHTRIASGHLSATVAADGAELIALEAAGGLQLLWEGDPRWWGGRSPLLFPIVGRLPQDEALIDGRRWPLKQHGFARTTRFALVQADAASCSYELSADADLLKIYPRDFSLRVTYRIREATLTMHALVRNRETQRAMPFSFGFHPAFRWPLTPHAPRQDHILTFDAAEPAPIRRPVDGLLATESEASPLQGRHLPLTDALFEGGALVFDQLRSRRIVYGAANGPCLQIDFQGMPHLGIWTKPGAPYLCIEPWHGFAAHVGFDDELANKPGIINLPPRAEREFQMTVRVR